MTGIINGRRMEKKKTQNEGFVCGAQFRIALF